VLGSVCEGLGALSWWWNELKLCWSRGIDMVFTMSSCYIRFE